MQAVLKWNEGMKFQAEASGQVIVTDAKTPLGKGQGMTPKELVLAGLGGCTAMDVVALFKKHKQNVESFDVIVDVKTSVGVTPMVFTEALISFKAHGPIDPKIFIDSVVLSQTKYCGVSAMLLKAFPISYEIELNNEIIHRGQSQFL